MRDPADWRFAPGGLLGSSANPSFALSPSAELLSDGSRVDDRQTGEVSSFDDDRGLGTITGADGTEITFHCTAIADGTRTIQVGSAVSYLTRPRHLGRWEAADLRPA